MEFKVGADSQDYEESLKDTFLNVIKHFCEFKQNFSGSQLPPLK